jgi:hypothetical protein
MALSEEYRLVQAAIVALTGKEARYWGLCWGYDEDAYALLCDKRQTAVHELTAWLDEHCADGSPCTSHKKWRTVVLESPYAGDVERNIRYVRACMGDCIKRGDAPFPSHALYTQEGVLNDDIPQERDLGIDAGLAIGARLEATVVYVDLGISRGMAMGIERAEREGRPVERRSLPEWQLVESEVSNG